MLCSDFFAYYDFDSTLSTFHPRCLFLLGSLIAPSLFRGSVYEWCGTGMNRCAMCILNGLRFPMFLPGFLLHQTHHLGRLLILMGFFYHGLHLELDWD